MFIIILLLFIIFSPSFQTMKAAFYCEDLIKEIYIEDPVTQERKQIGYGPTKLESYWNTPAYFPELDAAPGDTLLFNCYSYSSVASCLGGGCFLINDICRCYSFDNGYKPYMTLSFSTNIDGKVCKIDTLRTPTGYGTFTYKHQIPLDANGITC